MERRGEYTLRPVERAIWLAIIAGIYLAVYLIPEAILRANLCLFKQFTGLDCPLCGMTESVHLAARGKIFESVSKHPMGVALLASIFFLAPFIAAGKIPAALARYGVLVCISGFAAWWLLKTFFI